MWYDKARKCHWTFVVADFSLRQKERRLKPATTRSERGKNMTLDFLKNFGLTEKEANLYELLLKLGETPVGDLIREAKLKRATAYKTLYELEKKGLISKRDIGKIIHFRPEPPTKLFSLAEEQTKLLERAREDLRSILPQLSSAYIVSVERPIITTFEGIEGIKQVFADIYGPKDEPVYGCVDLEKSDEAVPEYVVKKLIPLRIKNKVLAKSFIASSNQAKKLARKDSRQLRESILLPKKEFPLPAEIDVYQDKVALLCFSQGQFMGVLIQNKDIATSLKTIFKLAFESKKKVKPKRE